MAEFSGLRSSSSCITFSGNTREASFSDVMAAQLAPRVSPLGLSLVDNSGLRFKILHLSTGFLRNPAQGGDCCEAKGGHQWFRSNREELPPVLARQERLPLGSRRHQRQWRCQKRNYLLSL